MGLQGSKVVKNRRQSTYYDAYELFDKKLVGETDSHDNSYDEGSENDLPNNTAPQLAGDETRNYYHDDDFCKNEITEWVIIGRDAQFDQNSLSQLSDSSGWNVAAGNHSENKDNDKSKDKVNDDDDDSNSFNGDNDESSNKNKDDKNDLTSIIHDTEHKKSYDSSFKTLQRKFSRAVSMESFQSDDSTTGSSAYMAEMCINPVTTRLQIFLKYDPIQWVLTVGVKQAESGLDRKRPDRPVYWSVHMLILPHGTHKHKTRYKSTQTPIFNQSFDVPDVPKAALAQMAVRYRLYGRYRRVGRKKMMGEIVVSLEDLLLSTFTTIDGQWWTLKNKICKDQSGRSKSISYF